MSYRETFLKQIAELKKYKELREKDPATALKFGNVLRANEACHQTGRFFRLMNNRKDEIFGGKPGFDAFIGKHKDLFPEGKFPYISIAKNDGTITLSDIDYEKVCDAIDEEFKDHPEIIEQTYGECAPNYRDVNHPMTEIVNTLKNDVDTLFEDEKEKKELKAALDYANEEIVEKTGANLVDDAVDANSSLRNGQAVKNFSDFVEKKGMDKTVVTNNSKSNNVISAGFALNPRNYEKFQPFLKMEISYDQDYKDKLLALDKLCREEGLLSAATGGESPDKEYGLTDYFVRNYGLKKALTDYGKLTDQEEKKAALNNIKALTEDVKTVSAKYDKVLSFIEKNFDLDNISLPGNVYSGRPGNVRDGDVENWRPNLPPKYDFEKSPAVVFLNGFTQLKSAAQVGEVSLKDYLDNPTKVYLNGVKKLAQADEQKIYLPPSEENTLGKRMAHVLYHSGRAFDEIAGYNVMGGRGLEFLYNTSPNNDQAIGNVIASSIIKEYGFLYSHTPGTYFGTYFFPNIDKMKNLFVAGDEVEKLYQVSPDYVNGEAKLDSHVKDYGASVRHRGNVPVDQEYRRIIKAIKDCCEEEEEMFQHKEQYLKGEKDNMCLFSRGALLCAGRQYFVDYLRENNLTLASIEDDALRQEVSDFMANPVQTFHDKHYRFPEEGLENLSNVKAGFASAWRKFGSRNSQAFMDKFAEHNNRPNGYNVGKNIATILNDNRGGFWERFRGTTSKQYQALAKAAQASVDPSSPTKGDKEAMYACAKAYKAYKMPEGRTFASLGKTAQKRIEFCDSVIKAYEEEKRIREAANNPQPIANSNIINQQEFQHQLENDLGPKEPKPVKVEEIQEKAAEKDPLDNTASV